MTTLPLGVASLPAMPGGLSTTQQHRWASLERGFAVKLVGVFHVLTGQGYQPIVADGWRDPSTQAALKASGKSKVDWSFHNAVDDQGKPAALAADVVDQRFLWTDSEANAAFLRALGRAAEAAGLTWGGGNTYKRSNPVWAKYSLSWDPTHVQAYPNGALGQIRAQSQAVWGTLRRGNVAALPAVVAHGYWRIVSALPWFYWAGVGGFLFIVIVGLARRRRRARSASSTS